MAKGKKRVKASSTERVERVKLTAEESLRRMQEFAKRKEQFIAAGRLGYYLVSPRCPCYCGGEGMLVLVACPHCGAIMGRCDEVDELIRNVREPRYVPDESICYPDQLCPECGQARYGDFRPATEAEVLALGFRAGQYRKWPV